MGQFLNLFLQILKIFCNDNNQNKPHGQNQQHQQQGGWNNQQGNQQQGGWNNQQNNHQNNSNNQYPPAWNQGQQQSGHSGSPHDDPQYTQMRNQARHEGDIAHKCFADSQNAYKSGDGARAKQLSEQGKQHQRNQDEIDDRAAEWIFTANNKSNPVGTIDLHGLYVKEAIEQTEKAIANGQRSGLEELRVITGKGIHSRNHQAKIKPAVAELMQKYNLSAEIDPHNTGVLVVDLQGRTMGGRTRDAGGIVDRMGDKDADCVIM